MLTRYSERSIRRLVNLFIGLEDTPYIYPQTLTFWPAEFSPNRAKRLLDALLSNLHKCFDMASIHVRHYHKTGAIHYHALFAFWDRVPFPPSRMKAEFGTRVFNAWSNLQDGQLRRRANRMTEHESNLSALRYLMRRVRSSKQPTKSQRWWTYRNAGLLRKRAKLLSPAERRQAFKFVIPWRPYKIRHGKDFAAPIGIVEDSFGLGLDALINFDALEVKSRALDSAVAPFEEVSQVVEHPF